METICGHWGIKSRNVPLWVAPYIVSPHYPILTSYSGSCGRLASGKGQRGTGMLQQDEVAENYPLSVSTSVHCPAWNLLVATGDARDDPPTFPASPDPSDSCHPPISSQPSNLKFSVTISSARKTLSSTYNLLLHPTTLSSTLAATLSTSQPSPSTPLLLPATPPKRSISCPAALRSQCD